MKIIEILKQKSENPIDDVKIELKLYTLADDLEKKSRAHLKRIMSVLTEFDIHDEKHSEKVIENIERLLGEEKLLSLSTYELFLLHMSAFFHDCAMAPSDWEINTMKLTEGNETHFQSDYSIKYDLKSPLKFSIAQQTITSNKQHLYQSFSKDITQWMFSPRSEEELISYLSELLIEYQNYRNGFADQLKAIRNQTEFNKLNDFIRIDYIRATHHRRIETYIKNLEGLFSGAFEQPAWGKKLAHDLSLICRSHGEDAAFINDFSTNAQYYGSDSANLQFVAIMLRLGDIIHFSYDRAPIDLRSSKLFQSEYSFQQWAIKYSGVNYSIENGKISFRAYCDKPETYFKLHQYIDWIEIEIQNYFKFQRIWKINYIENLQDKVERTNITNDEDNFLPKRGLNFSLNQKKILDLLMGVGLYKDKYACLRELYQNSLDACRCMLSQNEISGTTTIGKIEFRIDREDDKTYLCCIDNGIGMTKDIIEKYLLKIGNSYYKSSDFYKQQANWGGKFTPTSQFGIGILSCFMIGDKIEITTKAINEDYVSCSIDGPYDNFYYKKTTSIEKEDIPVSGTMVRVLLNNESAITLNDKKIKKLGLLLLGLSNHLPDKFSSYIIYLQNWEKHIFNLLNHFVQIIPPNIEVIIGMNDGSKLNIPQKPIMIDFENVYLEIETDDFELVDHLINNDRINTITCNYSEIKEYVETYILRVHYRKTEYVVALTLPKNDFVFENIESLYSIPMVGESGICIDGIYIDNGNPTKSDKYYLGALSRNGIINFTGELRPQLSVDRTSIIEYPTECEKVAEEMSRLLLKEILNTTLNHIVKYNLNSESNEFILVWEYVFAKIGFADTLFINELSDTEYGNIVWKNLNDKLEVNMSIRDFLESENIIVKSFNIMNTDILTEKLLLTKLISAQEVKVSGSNILIRQEKLLKTNLIPRRNTYSEHQLLICADMWDIFDSNFDLVSNLYPLIPKKLFDLLGNTHNRKIKDKIIQGHVLSNGIQSLFSQNPLLINVGLGLYMKRDSHFRNRTNEVYNFENKRSKFWLHELNINTYGQIQNEIYVLLVFINPIELTKDQNDSLEKYINDDPSYVKGVREGWSLLATSKDIDNIIICPGKTTREHLVSLISDEFWDEYKDCTFKFTDNTIMKKIEN